MEEIMNEITECCETCPLCQKCPEEECVLWRIEQIAAGKTRNPETVIKGQTTVYDFIAS